MFSVWWKKEMASIRLEIEDELSLTIVKHFEARISHLWAKSTECPEISFEINFWDR